MMKWKEKEKENEQKKNAKLESSSCCSFGFFPLLVFSSSVVIVFALPKSSVSLVFTVFLSFSRPN